jgi:hypothetical protein
MLWSAGAHLSAIGRVKGLQPEAARCWICRSLASVLELFVIDPICFFWRQGARYFSWLLRWPHSEAAIRIPSGQVLPEHLANILRENDLRYSAALASCGSRGTFASDFAVTRGRQESVNFACTCL